MDNIHLKVLETSDLCEDNMTPEMLEELSNGKGDEDDE